VSFYPLPSYRKALFAHSFCTRLHQPGVSWLFTNCPAKNTTLHDLLHNAFFLIQSACKNPPAAHILLACVATDCVTVFASQARPYLHPAQKPPLCDLPLRSIRSRQPQLSKEFFIQDICFPIEHTQEFLEFLDKELGIYPLWVCPLRPVKNNEFLCSHDLSTDLVLNIGIWGRTKKYLENPLEKNRLVEQFANKFKARKVLYAHQYYPQDEFWTLYDKNKYDNLREKYHANTMFTDIYSATHVSKLLDKNPWAGLKAVIQHIFTKL
jgi:hypothetical protein